MSTNNILAKNIAFVGAGSKPARVVVGRTCNNKLCPLVKLFGWVWNPSLPKHKFGWVWSPHIQKCLSGQCNICLENLKNILYI